jgi:phospholipase/lecithinase/hemolysin
MLNLPRKLCLTLFLVSFSIFSANAQKFFSNRGFRRSELRQTLSGITIIEFDVYAVFQDVRSDPGKYGLTNVTDAAFNDNTDTIAADVDHYLFWDGTHPTRVGHAIVGEKCVQANCERPGVGPWAVATIVG